MENTLENQNSINVLLGETVKKMQIPSKAAGVPPKVYIIHPLRLKEIAKIENFSEMPFIQWQEKNPFNKLSVLLYTVFISLSRNADFKYTYDEFEELFELADMESLGKLLMVVLEISGLQHVAADKGAQSSGNDSGAA